MSEELIKYDCRNCGHSVSTKLHVEGGAKCKECGSISMFPMLESIGAFNNGKHKDMSYELAYVFLVTIEEQMIKDVADDRCIDAIQTAQKLLKEKITGYADERTNDSKNACNNKTSVTELPERYRGIKISDTSSKIRSEIIKNDIDCLKDIMPEQMELLVQLFEKEKQQGTVNKGKANSVNSNYNCNGFT